MANPQRSCKEQQRRVLDEATRRRRARKALDSLEQDNFHDDPHADLVMSKKALSLFLEETEETKKSKRKQRTNEYYKLRFRKNFNQLLEEQAVCNDGVPNYFSAQAPSSSKPARHFCAVCGFPACQSCPLCGTRVCCMKCQDTHKETRCLKFTA